MGYFPLCVDLSEKTVLLVGSGPEIRDKAEKLRPFGPQLHFLDTLTEADLKTFPALVVVGDKEIGEAERISRLCMERNIPVNVVDRPELCSFSFPALIQNGDLTVSISTGGKSPAAAAYLRQQLQSQIPDRTDEILDSLAELRKVLKASCLPPVYREAMAKATATAFAQNRPLTREESLLIVRGMCKQ